MSTPSPSEPLFIDLERPLPGTWGLVAGLAVVHLASGMSGWGRLSAAEALVFSRPSWLRVAAGGQTAELVDGGQPWRLVTSVWLHADLLHILLNAMALLALGRILEPWLGASRLIGWFALGGVAGSLGSHLAGVGQSDGASGGAFALLGVALALGVRWRHRFDPIDARLMGPWLWSLTVVNVALSFVVPQIDVIAHLSGLLVGLLVGAVTSDSQRLSVAGLVLTVAFLTSSIAGWVSG